MQRLVDGIAHALEHALDAEDLARADGLLQRLDPRVKLGGLIGLVVMAVVVKSLLVLGGLLFVAVILARVSRVSAGRLLRQVWTGVFAFSGLIALPALFVVPGAPLVRLPLLNWPITGPGLRSALFLLGRAETTASFGLLLVLTTPWPHLLKAMRAFRLPVVVVVILGMTHRYIFVLLELAQQMFEARRSRHVGKLAPRDARRLATATAGVLLSKSLEMSGEIHLAMLSRGYRGEPRSLDDFALTAGDRWAVGGILCIGGAALLLQWGGLP